MRNAIALSFFLIVLSVAGHAWAGQAEVWWSYPSDISNTEIVGFMVYWGNDEKDPTRMTSRQLVEGAKTTSHTIKGLKTGQTYFVCVTAVDSSGNESDYRLSSLGKVVATAEGEPLLPGTLTGQMCR